MISLARSSIRAFDIIGDIAVLEAPALSEARKTAKKIILQHKHIKSAWLKIGGHEGRLRIQKLKWIAGEKRTTTIHKENGILLKLDIAKVYFSPRQATERKRVYEQVKKAEEVLVMFSGIGPFVIEIAKNSPAAAVYGVELNKAAHAFAVGNAKLNKVEAKTNFFCGDVRKVAPKLGQKFDRIVMPLPKGAGSFLDVALAAAKTKAAIHFYDFEKEENIPAAAIAKVTAAAKSAKKKIKILKVVKCGQLAPRAYRVCVDFGVQ